MLLVFFEWLIVKRKKKRDRKIFLLECLTRLRVLLLHILKCNEEFKATYFFIEKYVLID